MNHVSPPDWRAWQGRIVAGWEWLEGRIEAGLDRLLRGTDLTLDVGRQAVGHLLRTGRLAANHLAGEATAAGALVAAELRLLGRELGASSEAVRRRATKRGAAWARWTAVRAAASARWIRARTPSTLARFAPRVRPVHLAAVAASAVAGGSLLYMNCGLSGCPDVTTLSAFQPGGASVLIDRNGAHFADLAPFERAVVALDSLPEHVPAAFLAVEDHRFYRHRGVDPVRVVSALLTNLRSRRVREGSSTIPMQLARNVFPDRIPGTERTMRRKLQETRVARLIERQYEKDEILELYLNHIYFGGGAYGVEAAARLFFDKPATELTVAEAATLAALPKAPTHYDPRRHPERAAERRDLVLALMTRHGLATPEEIAAARDEALGVRLDGRDRSGIPLGAYFVDVIRDQLEARFGELPYRQRLVVYTTLDTVAQAAAERELAAQLASLDGRVRPGSGELQGAVVLLDARSGDVLALVGGRDPATSRYNRATKGRRQVGSAFKPFVFAAAMATGVPTSQLLLDTPLRVQLSRNDVWQPSNYDGRFEGQVPLRQALVRSRNVPTVRLASAVGIGDVAATARRAGLSDPMDETPALALGTVATSPLRMAAAYTAFATLGHGAEPRFVVRVEDEGGRVLWEPPHPPSRPVMDPALAYVVTDILRDAVDYGTGTGVRRAGFTGAVAGKTGTTNGATDVWFIGYTPDMVGTIWIGYDRPTPLGAGATGGGFAAPVWGRVMRQVYGAGTRPLPHGWPVPPGVRHRRVDMSTGLALQEGCYSRASYERTEVFTTYNLPESSCPRRDYWQELLERFRGGRQVQAESRGARPGRGPLPGRRPPR